MVDEKQVIETIKRYLEPYQPADYRLNVLETGVRHDGDWWYVVVPPGESIVNLSDYNARIEKAERDLRRQDNLSVGILPVIPDWMDTLKQYLSRHEWQVWRAKTPTALRAERQAGLCLLFASCSSVRRTVGRRSLRPVLPGRGHAGPSRNISEVSHSPLRRLTLNSF